MKLRQLTFSATLVAVAMVPALLRPVSMAQSLRYREIERWAQLPEGMQWGTVSGVATDTDGNVYGFRRAEPPIIKLDRHGAFVRSLGEKLFRGAHGIRIDRDRMLWAADVRGHVVYRLEPDGNVLLTIGQRGVSGEGPDTFNGPTDVAVTPSGDIFVTDGQMNHRIVHFSRDGRFIKAWGTEGSEPGQFKVPHSIAIDSAGRLFVADRDNGRIQIFDQDGRFLEQWTQFGAASGLFIASDDTLYVAAVGDKSGLLIANAKNGRIDEFLRIPAKEASGPHLVTVDSRGTVYVADLLANDLRKFVRQ